MRWTLSPASLLLVLAACQPPSSTIASRDPVSPAQTGSPNATPAATPTSTVPAPTPPALQPVTSLEGAWRVAGIDGEPFDEPYGLALTGDEVRLWWGPECANMGRQYRMDGNAISFSPLHAPSASRPTCPIGLPPRLSDVMRALDAATSIERTRSNGIQFAGGGHSLLLFSQ
ncbi:hypothetical protein [Novosphingobium sp. M1R2S20]|uniref:Heat shock protein HslJ n=1 Tax=Novosphingobium rhizovicinum TaxID=3228928 RepID=A0ABV3RFP5_9SPHN